MQVATEIITPNIATEMLRHNKSNRTISRAVAERYAKDILNGKWKLNGESIKIAKDGTLVDGQHRLTAIVMADKKVSMLVVRDVEPAAIRTVDTGKSRSAADHLKIHGMTGNLTVISAAVRLIKGIEAGTLRRNLSLTSSDAIEFCEAHPAIFHSYDRVASSAAKIIPASVATALHYLFSRTRPVQAETFFSQLTTGTNLAEGSPVLALRNRVLVTTANKRGNRTPEYVYCVIRAFEAFCDGESLSRIHYSADYPIRLPE